MIRFSADIEKQLKDEAFRTFPDECCGFLLGKENGEQRVVTEIIIADNSKSGDKRRRFEITSAQYMQAEREADEKELTLLGVYHSHPNHPSIPSEHDRLVAQPFFSYLIIAVREMEIVSFQSWRLNDSFHFDEEIFSISAIPI